MIRTGERKDIYKTVGEYKGFAIIKIQTVIEQYHCTDREYYNGLSMTYDGDKVVRGTIRYSGETEDQFTDEFKTIAAVKKAIDAGEWEYV